VGRESLYVWLRLYDKDSIQLTAAATPEFFCFEPDTQ
jgi:hypothetical protein